MKIVGIIAEYNPFHNGHLYHLRKARELSGADAVLVVMSGDFVQRGEPAVFSKHLRARMALAAGADLVLELPVCFATGSAEYFAAGAVSLLDSLGCVDALCFGSEIRDGQSEGLKRLARYLAEEPEEYKTALRQALRQGMTFPLAREEAVKNCLDPALLSGAEIETLLRQPNNILGLEYWKALYRQKSALKVYTVNRVFASHHDDALHKSGVSSASAIRETLRKAAEKEPASFPACLDRQIPPSCCALLRDAFQKNGPAGPEDLSLLLKYRLLTETKESLALCADLHEDLACRILHHVQDFASFCQFCQLLKTRDMTYTRISRSLLHLLLHIQDADLKEYRAQGFCRYARILGFRQDKAELLSVLKKHTCLPLITSPSQEKLLDGTGQKMLRQDIFASDLYESILAWKFKTHFCSEYQKPLIKL